MIRKGKLMSLALVFILLLGSLAACGNKGGNSNSNASSVNNGSSSSSSKVPSGQTITLWVWQGQPWLGEVKSIAQKWAKQHNDTVKVVDESKQPNGYQFYATAARTGKGPDVVFGIAHDNLGVFQKEGLIAQVPSKVMNLSNYPASVKRSVLLKGKPYAVPVSVQTSAIFYNKKLIKTPPKTWNEFVTDANKSGFMYDQANLYFNYALIGGLGGFVFKDKNGSYNTKNIGLDNSGSVKAYTLMHQMDSKYHWMTPSVNGSIAKGKFTSGKLGMYVSGPWDIADIKKAGIDYGIAPWPTLSNGKSATPFTTVQTTIVSQLSKHKTADWSLVQAITNKAAQVDYYKKAAQIPALSSAEQNSGMQNNPDTKAFIEQMKTAVPQPNVPEMQAVYSAMSILGNIIKGKVSPSKGAKSFVQNIQKGIKVQNS